MQGLIDSGHYRLEPDNTLVITEATVWDSTKYTCIAKTELDRRERTATLTVRDVPHPPYSAWSVCADRSVVIKFIHTESVGVAAPVREFWVQYLVDPETDADNWQWVVAPVREPWGEKQRVSEDGKYRTIEAPITVQLSPFGHYHFRVVARNDVGDSAPHQVQGPCETASAVPERNPASVRAEGNTPENLVVYWEPMEREEWNGRGFHYLVEYRRKDDEDGEWESVKVEDPHRDHVVIPDQPMFKAYDVRVAAVNDEGRASVSPATVEGTSGQGIPSAAPEGFELIDKSATSATFKWDPVPADSVQGRLGGYKIVHWPVSGDPDVQVHTRRKRSVPDDTQEAIFDPTATTGTVYGLKPYADNKLYILAFNDANDGPPSDTLTVRTPEGVPSPVRGLAAYPLSATEVGVVWRPPRQANGNLQGFIITWCKGSSILLPALSLPPTRSSLQCSSAKAALGEPFWRPTTARTSTRAAWTPTTTRFAISTPPTPIASLSRLPPAPARATPTPSTPPRSPTNLPTVRWSPPRMPTRPLPDPPPSFLQPPRPFSRPAKTTTTTPISFPTTHSPIPRTFTTTTIARATSAAQRECVA